MKDTLIFNNLMSVYQSNSVSNECIQDIVKFKTFLETLNPSKDTHYDKLDDWSTLVYSFIRNLLNKYGFVNGKPEKNKENSDGLFIFELYCAIGNICHSPFLENESVSVEKSSAFARNEALIKELDNFLSHYNQ